MEPFTRRDFNTFIQNLSDNPLSPQGTAAAKLEQLAADIRVLADFVTKQQATEAQNEETRQQSAESLH